MSNAVRDANFVPIVIGQNDTTSGTLELELDFVTGEVLAELYLNSNGSSSAPVQRALRDANFIPNLIGLADDSSGHTLSAAIDSRNGYLYCDTIFT